MTSRRGRFAYRLAALFLSCAAMFAQSTSGDLTGTIYDATGATIPGAAITATNTATGIQVSTTTTSSGQYRLSNLLVGTYNLSVSASGFTKAELKNVSVELNKASTTNVTLSVGTAATSVEVSAASAAIDTTSAQVQNSFATRQLENLPSAATGAGIINLSLLDAGVATSGAVGAGTGPSIGGQRPRNNSFMIEGVDDNDKSVTGPIANVPNDAVAEFTVLQNQFSPEFGHSSGGQFNTVVKGGTNQFHGSLYEYMQNRNLNAADQLSIVDGVDPHPRLDDNRLGASLGGPIKRNKLFFFLNYEYNPVGQSGGAGQIFAPTQSGYDTLASIPGINQTNLGILKEYLPGQSTAVAPGVLPNGVYPTVDGRTIEVGQFSILAPNYENNSNGVAAVDYQISDKDSLRGRFIMNRQDFIDNAANLPAFFTTVPYRAYIATLSEYHNFSATMTNELRLGFSRSLQVYGVGDQQFSGLDAFPNITLDDLNVNIGPDSNAPQETVQNNYQLSDNLTWIKGNHTLKFGFSGYKHISPQSFTQRARGDYEWSDLESYLFDLYPDFGERTLGNVIYYGDQINTGEYVNDQWKVHPNLTLNLGLRYEYTTLPYSERLQGVNSISDVPGLITFREPKAQKTNFMPRIGFAYSPGTSGNTSIRGGFGINYDVLFDNLGILSLPPQFNQTVDVGGLAGSNFLAGGGISPSAQAGVLNPTDARAATSGFVPDQKLPKSLQWNLGIQHVFHQDYTFEARYLGSRGVNLPIQQRLNDQSVVNAQNALPLFYQQPSQATLDALPNTLGPLEDTFNANGSIVPAYLNAGFTSYITSYMPIGNSTYHGLATQLTRRFSNGLQFTGSYTWSHNIDDSTAEVFSTVTTPRRPQDFQDLRADRADSALDHRQRFTFAMVYDLPFFKNSNWFMKNIVGNWLVAPIYTYQTGTWVTVLSKTDANLNGDDYTDRAIINPSGTENIGSGTTALSNTAGETVGYLANDPSARYIQAPEGTLPSGARNTERVNPIDDIDLTLVKRVSIGERYQVELGAQFFNVLNHPQYVAGYLNDVRPLSFTGTAERNFLNPASTLFYHPDQVFSSNPRTVQISAKFVF